MTRKQAILIPLISLFFLFQSVAVFGQAWSGIISSSRAVDWRNAGAGTIPARTTICATLNPGASGSQINSAIASCPSGQTVLLNAGTYNISGGIVFNGKSNVTIRGAGADKTLLVFSSPDSCTGQAADVCVRSGDVNWSGGPSNSASWTAGYAKGTTNITLSSTSNLKVGSPLILDQLDDSTDNGTIFICQDSAKCAIDGPSGTSRNDRGQVQVVTVAACGTSTQGAACTSNNVTISPGLYMPNWRSYQERKEW
jgi:hypothetical protein